MNKLFADEVSAQAAVTVPSSERHAALLLHAMGEADRDWALARLQPAERVRLLPLLDELRELGVPADRQWVTQTLGTAPAAAATSRQRVAAADADRMAHLLMAEPAQLVQRVLTLGPWPWSEAVRAALRARRGELFEPVAAPEAAAPALDQALLERLAARLTDASPARRDSPALAGSAWARWRRRITAWQGHAR